MRGRNGSVPVLDWRRKSLQSEQLNSEMETQSAGPSSPCPIGPQTHHLTQVTLTWLDERVFNQTYLLDNDVHWI